jgi:hypothetical protein
MLTGIGVCLTVPDYWTAVTGDGFNDFQRQWAVCQYIRIGRNPYAVSAAIIRHGRELGWTPPPMLTDVRAVPGYRDAEGVIPDIQPPDTTYPPSAILFLTYTVGLLPAWVATALWATLNLFLLGFLWLCLIRQAIPEASGAALPAALTATGFILVWPPTQAVLYCNQFTFFALACVLLALDSVETSSWRAGLWFALALSKPSIALLFLCYPVVRGRWAVVAIAGAVHATALLIVSGLVSSSPQELVRLWLDYSSHCLWTMYSIQEILSRIGPRLGPAAGLIRPALLGAILLWCWYNRTASKERILDFLCFANLIWVGHGNYDFTLLLLPAMHSIRRLYDVTGAWRVAALELVGYAAIGVGLTYSVFYQGEEGDRLAPVLGKLYRLARWACRLALGGMIVWQARFTRPAAPPTHESGGPAVNEIGVEAPLAK